jgi:hypothetical protein
LWAAQTETASPLGRRGIIPGNSERQKAATSGGSKKVFLATRPQAEQAPVLLTIKFALLHRLFQFLLVISQKSMKLVVRFVADRVNLRSKILPRGCWILVEQRRNPIVVLLKQRPDLLMLFRSQLQIFRKTSQFLVDGPWIS